MGKQDNVHLDNILMRTTARAPPSPWGSPQISKLPRVPIGKSGKQLNLEILGLRSPHAGPFVDVPRIWESTGSGHGDRPQHQMCVGGQGGGARKLSESFWTFVTGLAAPRCSTQPPAGRLTDSNAARSKKKTSYT